MRASAVHVAAGLLCLAFAGCGPEHEVGEAAFSPDGRLVAFVWIDQLRAFLSDKPRAVQAVHVCWCPAERAGEPDRSEVRVDRLGPAFGETPAASVVHLRFSPDSRHVAVVAPNAVTVVDPQTGVARRVTPGGEQYSSFAWLSDEEIAYVAFRPPGLLEGLGSDAAPMERTVWCQRIAEPPEARRLVYRHVAAAPGTFAGRYAADSGEHWSPDGRFLLFLRPLEVGQWYLLDVERTTVRAFGSASALGLGAAWTSDGSQAVVLSWIVEPGKTMQAILLDTRGGRAFDISKPFADCFPDGGLPGGWTPDGEYLVVNGVDGGCLVRPEPWTVHRVARKLVEQVDPIDITWRPTVGPLPVPGWVRMTGAGGRPFVTSRQHFAVSCDGGQVVSLGMFSGTWVASPDGRRAAEIDAEGHVAITPLNLPPASTTGPATAPAGTNER